MSTRTDALLSQLETGKIDCVHLPHYGRLSPGAGMQTNAGRAAGVPAVFLAD
jgi:hypothetical protein